MRIPRSVIELEGQTSQGWDGTREARDESYEVYTRVLNLTTYLSRLSFFAISLLKRI